MKVLLIGSHHGHELLGDHLWEYIKNNRPDLLKYLEFMIANPKAKSAGVRQIESDMNRSYNGKGSTYEEKIASLLLDKIIRNNYDFVLDLHTTTTDIKPTIIVANFKYSWKFIKSSNITQIVKMPQKIAGVSFIGNFSNSASIEVNEDSAKQQDILELICDDIYRFINGVADNNHKKNFFEVKSYYNESTKTRTNNNKSNLFLSGEKSYGSNQFSGFVMKKISQPYIR